MRRTFTGYWKTVNTRAAWTDVEVFGEYVLGLSKAGTVLALLNKCSAAYSDGASAAERALPLSLMFLSNTRNHDHWDLIPRARKQHESRKLATTTNLLFNKKVRK